MDTKYRKKLGKWGEELAREYYEKLGYKFVGANWQKKVGEIDLIMKSEEEIIFVEVKTRTTPFFGYGEGAVNRTKKKKLQQTINWFRYSHSEFERKSPRFDILVVELFGFTPNFVRFENISFDS